MLKSVDNIFESLLEILNYVSVITIFFVAVWIFGDVFGRYIFNSPIPGTTELVQTAMLAIVFLGIPYTLRQNLHIRTTLLVRHLSNRYQAILSMIIFTLGAVTFVAMTLYGFDVAVRAWRIREYAGVHFRIPSYPTRFVYVMGSALMAIQYGLLAARAFWSLIHKQGE